ncbi:MAG: CRISPR-associated endonuclease Cas6 [Saprospiraceae bacterium]
MKKQIKTLHIQTSIPHHPTDAQSLRARLIEHAIITFLIQLRPQYPKLFYDVKAIEVLNRILGKNNGNLTDDKEEQIDHITALLYETYPDLIYFHNHAPDGSRQEIAYPLIHYRSKRGKAEIYAFADAIPIVEQWLAKADYQSWMSYGQVKDKKEESQQISILKTPKYYRLMDWLALNTDNYQRWLKNVLLKDRVTILEEALTGHLRRLAQAFIKQDDWSQIKAELIMITKTKEVKAYHHNDLAFNILFRANVDLPTSLAIGRSVSLGYGTQSLTRWQGEEKQIITHIQSELATASRV